eukprot:SAG31_NODE_3549_length_4134_cov_3.066171_3_plen_76_part_00
MMMKHRNKNDVQKRKDREFTAILMGSLPRCSQWGEGNGLFARMREGGGEGDNRFEAVAHNPPEANNTVAVGSVGH